MYTNVTNGVFHIWQCVPLFLAFCRNFLIIAASLASRHVPLSQTVIAGRVQHTRVPYQYAYEASEHQIIRCIWLVETFLEITSLSILWRHTALQCWARQAYLTTTTIEMSPCRDPWMCLWYKIRRRWLLLCTCTCKKACLAMSSLSG